MGALCPCDVSQRAAAARARAARPGPAAHHGALGRGLHARPPCSLRCCRCLTGGLWAPGRASACCDAVGVLRLGARGMRVAQVWNALGDPSSSRVAYGFFCLILTLILVSCVAFVVETIPSYCCGRYETVSFRVCVCVCVCLCLSLPLSLSPSSYARSRYVSVRLCVSICVSVSVFGSCV